MPKADSLSSTVLGKWSPGLHLALTEQHWLQPQLLMEGLPSPKEVSLPSCSCEGGRNGYSTKKSPAACPSPASSWDNGTCRVLRASSFPILPCFDLKHQCSPTSNGLGRARVILFTTQSCIFVASSLLCPVCVCWAAQWIYVANVSLPIKQNNQPQLECAAILEGMEGP